MTDTTQVPGDGDVHPEADDGWNVVHIGDQDDDESALADDDRALALAFMRKENEGDGRVRPTNENMVWEYDWIRGLWRRLDERQLREFNGRLYEFVRRHMSPGEKPSRITSRYRSVHRVLLETVGEFVICPTDLDANPGLIAFRDGIYDIAEGRLLPHSPDHMLTIGRDYDYDPDARCPRFERFLGEVLVRHLDPESRTGPLVPDPELRLLVEELLGYCLVAHCRAERWFLLSGEGRNGKSTLINVIRLLVGENNVCDFDVRDIRNRQMNADLLGKLVALQPELEVGTTFPDAALKALASGEAMTAKVVYERPFRFKPIATVIMATNNVPQTRDHSRGFRERMVVVPFLATFDNETADRELLRQLEPERAGIFNLAMRGYRRLRDNGWRFTEVASVQEATGVTITESDPVQLWFDDSLRPAREAARVSTATLYDDYAAYCTRFRYRVENHNTFAKRLRRIVDDREGQPWATAAPDGTPFCMEFHRSGQSRAYRGTFELGRGDG